MGMWIKLLRGSANPSQLAQLALVRSDRLRLWLHFVQIMLETAANKSFIISLIRNTHMYTFMFTLQSNLQLQFKLTACFNWPTTCDTGPTYIRSTGDWLASGRCRLYTDLWIIISFNQGLSKFKVKILDWCQLPRNRLAIISPTDSNWQRTKKLFQSDRIQSSRVVYMTP